jgi:sialate O-acetylesterase
MIPMLATALAPIFQDHMVMQRGMEAPVWGTASPGERVTVELAGRSAFATAGPDGAWSLRLPPLEAGGPWTLTARGSSLVEIRDVLAGDVWLCGGQSNMAMGLGALKTGPEEAAKADYPDVRLFTVAHSISIRPTRELGGRWEPCGPESAPRFSAAGYFFGRRLHQDLGVPIGLISCNWGGTPAEAWTGAGALKKLGDFDKELKLIRGEEAVRKAQEKAFDKALRWYKAKDPGTRQGWEAPGLDDSAWEDMPVPGIWEKRGREGFDGVAWYRLAFDVDAADAEGPAALGLGPIDDRDTTFLNGRIIGHSDSWDSPRKYPIAAGLLKPGRNSLAVRVLDAGGDGPQVPLGRGRDIGRRGDRGLGRGLLPRGGPLRLGQQPRGQPGQLRGLAGPSLPHRRLGLGPCQAGLFQPHRREISTDLEARWESREIAWPSHSPVS